MTRPRLALPGITEAVSLLRHGYRFWELKRQETGSEIVQTRLAHEHVTAVRGADGATFFYREKATERATALPMSLVRPLFGSGPVHTLDGVRHAHRKQMFNELLGPEAVRTITDDVARRWDERVPRWTRHVDVFQQVGEILFEAGCDWVGIPVPADEVPSRTRDMLAMVDGFGAPTPRQVRARRARRRTDAWVTGLVEQARRSDNESSTPLAVVARHRDEDGELLDAHTAAVEVINLVRPLVAVSWLVSGLFEAYDTHPDARADLLAGRVSAMDAAQEVRRTYPFVPFLATRATADLEWHGVRIPSGTLIVLDVWGTNLDPRIWTDPTAFDPGRFERTPVTPYNLVPQGGGFRDGGHRCPGEDTTLAVLTTLARRVAELSYEIAGPRSDLRRMPPKAQLSVRVAPAR